ncbi:50S ribosomal protein L13 [Candidatus Roizmanbacteria bacterium RIFCSPLOWO2_01_FULL_37_12]|uniref:Large ribosomal subunit protein uL13 n=1 Tax=Candidatus Roizmanbacteria bacterium RIFCSPLOWO2_01_FULL_37_12 TaxID=1802056 RepID=A0A1F7IBU2_9BACT|nr:MAG: 50S ribosomal protein L13 [Candidatus Roizmanbacteria bacterium RIFCSPHIGHO2_01_FULL_37_16]OGK25991.1 MAG: 50S ribosomal protein L13 [Candidatus Roizmanbacteria bacterium RIFCSPHIGHO2_02_FULL_37_9b]OGK40827.1 MAG: 50S ribosomal protein L13 [Candidatus Roizmanbacteria bacterium RIFCSPLOWO2_01_FULL_37_12]
MVSLTHSTKSAKHKEIKRNWHLVDVKGKILGRVVPNAAKLLQGKHKVDYSQYLDCGDYVVVTNARYVTVSGKKSQFKLYTSYSGYPGGLKTLNFEQLLNKNPGKLIRHAVSGMLPKNKLRDRRLARLFIFADEKHPYKEKLKINI